MSEPRFLLRGLSALAVLALCALPATAQTFRVQCPNSTALHPLVNGAPNPDIKCQQISGGDGFATMADGTQTYLFAFGPLSGLHDMVNGLPGTQPASVFNTPDPLFDNAHGEPNALTTYNGAVGLTRDPDLVADPTKYPECSSASPPSYCNPASPYYALDGHVDPRLIMDVGVLNGNMPAPQMAIDEDDEFFLTLTNVGMVMRPDLFEQHTVHFHGYPNASSFYDGVPDASVAINIGGSFTYYYLAPDAGTYMWHCHITPPEHLQMGMVGQVYVRPRQDKLSAGASLYNALAAIEAGSDAESLRRKCGGEVLCSTPLPSTDSGAVRDPNANRLYAYNDGDGTTVYDVEYPIQIHGFDPDFHFVGMTFNPESFADMKDKYFLLNGRSYPDTVQAGSMSTQASDGIDRYSQPLPTIINVPQGGRALLRISDLDVSEHQTLASLGIPMHVVGWNARLLRDLAGNNLYYDTNSVTLGGGESADVILDANRPEYAGCTTASPCTFYLYTPNLDHLSNDAENFGGLMTEVHVCSAVDPATKACI